jgi:hypothetical protein
MDAPAYAQYAAFGDPGAIRSRSGGGTGLVAVNENIDGGSIPTGATAQVVVRFRNDGPKPIETGIIRLYPASTVSAVVSMNQCKEEPLMPEAECAIALQVKGLQPGPWRVEMLMSHSGKARLVTSTLSGTVEPSGDSSDALTSDVEAIPNKVEFGQASTNQTMVEPITLRNITSNPIEIQNIYIDTSEQSNFTLKTECKNLDVGQACIAIVSWSPKSNGKASGVLVIEHDGPTKLTTVPIIGEYEPQSVEEATIFPQAVPGKGLLVSSQTDVDFGQDISTASTITVSLVNAGDSDITLSDIRFSGSDNGLSFKDNGCKAAMTLEPVQACPLTITWSPTRTGDLIDDVQVIHDGARGVLVLPIRGASSAAVSQDQKAIDLSATPTVTVIDGTEKDDTDIAAGQASAARNNAARISQAAVSSGVSNPKSVLDGYKITSFSASRAIINGPGGSRIVFDGKDALIGGISWNIDIQDNGIEFESGLHRILLLFDRSLSTINRINNANSAAASSGSSSADGE